MTAPYSLHSSKEFMTTLTRLLPLTALLLGSALALTVPQREQHARDVFKALNLRVTPCRADLSEILGYDVLCAATTLAPDRVAAEWTPALTRRGALTLTVQQQGSWVPNGKKTLGLFRVPDGTTFLVMLDPVHGEAQVAWGTPTEGSRMVDLSAPGKAPEVARTDPVTGFSVIPGATLPGLLHAGAPATRPAGPFTVPATALHDHRLLGPVKRAVTTFTPRPGPSSLGKRVDTLTFDTLGRILTDTTEFPESDTLWSTTTRYDGPRLMDVADLSSGETSLLVYEHAGGVTTGARGFDPRGRLTEVQRFVSFPNGYRLDTFNPAGLLTGVTHVLQDDQGRIVRWETARKGAWLVNTYEYDGARRVAWTSRSNLGSRTATSLPDGEREESTGYGTDRPETVVRKVEARDAHGNPTVTQVFNETTQGGTVTLTPTGTEHHTYEYHQ